MKFTLPCPREGTLYVMTIYDKPRLICFSISSDKFAVIFGGVIFVCCTSEKNQLTFLVEIFDPSKGAVCWDFFIFRHVCLSECLNRRAVDITYKAALVAWLSRFCPGPLKTRQKVLIILRKMWIEYPESNDVEVANGNMYPLCYLCSFHLKEFFSFDIRVGYQSFRSLCLMRYA